MTGPPAFSVSPSCLEKAVCAAQQVRTVLSFLWAFPTLSPEPAPGGLPLPTGTSPPGTRASHTAPRQFLVPRGSLPPCPHASPSFLQDR